MAYQYTVHLDYVGAKDLEFADLEISLDDVLTITFESSEDLSHDEIADAFDEGIFEEVAMTIEQVTSLSIDESEVEIGSIETEEV